MTTARACVGFTDTKGKVVQKFVFDSFGNLRAGGAHKIKQPYSFTGREFDRETRLYYYRARYYNPEVGRFMGRDVFGGFPDLPQTLNRYPYVLSNPVNLVDADGVFPIVAVGLGAGVGGLVKGGFDAYVAWQLGQDLSEIGEAFGYGFLSGAVAGGTAVALSALGVGAIITGSAAALAGSLTADSLNWQMPDPIETVSVTAFGGATGGLLNRISGLRPIGGVSKYPQNWSSGFGENSMRLTIRQAFSSTFNTLFRTGLTSFINPSMPVPGLK